MENLALYRKYRPLTFDQVVGQNSITSSLSSQVENGRVSHAYLFTGTRGTGKTTCAKILARAICCQSPVGGSPCNQCPACRAMLSGAAMDITEIDAASNNGVDNIRELRQEAVYAPTELKYRVYIIDEVHMLSQGAFNALLKTLEEPPSHVVFILATTEIHKVPATILSRCQRYDFRRIPAEIMAATLEDVARQDGFGLEHAAADLLATMGDGSMRDSLSLLDRAKGASDYVSVDTVTDALGLATEKEILDIFSAILAGDAAAAVSVFTACYMSGRDIVAIFDNLLSLLRDIYLYKATKETDYLLSRWRLKVSELAEQCSVSRLEGCIESINFFLGRTTRTSAKRLDAEMCLIKMALPGFGVPVVSAPQGAKPAAGTEPPKAAAPAASPEAVPQQPDAPRNGANDAPPPGEEAPPWETEPVESPTPRPEPQRRPEPEPTPEPVRTQYQDTPAASPDGQDEKYAALLAGLAGKVNSAVRVYLKNAQLRGEDGGLYIEVPEEGLIFIGKPEVMSSIEEAGRSVGYAFVKVGAKKPVKKEDPLEKLRDRAIGLGVNVKIK